MSGSLHPNGNPSTSAPQREAHKLRAKLAAAPAAGAPRSRRSCKKTYACPERQPAKAHVAGDDADCSAGSHLRTEIDKHHD